MIKTKNIQRVNFIEREPFVLSYQKMAIIFCVCIFSCVGVFGFQYGNYFFTSRKLSQLETELIGLKVQRENILKARKKQMEGLGPNRGKLMQIFDDSKNWSSIFREITSKTPHALWLTSVKAEDVTDSQKNKKQSSSQENSTPAPEVKKTVIKLIGQANAADSVTIFLKSLADSKYFDDVNLVILEQEKGPNGDIYKFSLNLSLKKKVEDGNS